MIISTEDLQKIVHSFQLNCFTVVRGPLMIEIMFEDIHWHSFTKMYRIKKCKQYLEKKKPIGVLIKYYIEV